MGGRVLSSRWLGGYAISFAGSLARKSLALEGLEALEVTSGDLVATTQQAVHVPSLASPDSPDQAPDCQHAELRVERLDVDAEPLREIARVK
jgi:hypothetical protein